MNKKQRMKKRAKEHARETGMSYQASWNQLFGGAEPGAPTPHGLSPLSTGSAALDRLISGDASPCEGYPSGTIVQVCIPEECFESIREIVLQTYPGPVTIVRSSGLSLDLPERFQDAPVIDGQGSKTVLDDPNIGVAQTWMALSAESESRLVVLDNVRLGTSGQDAAALTNLMSAFLPQAKRRIVRTGHAILGFAKIVPDRDPRLMGLVENPVTAHGGRTWRYHSAVRMSIERWKVSPAALVVKLLKNKTAPTQGLTTLLAVRNGRIDDEATAALLSSVFDIPFDDPATVFTKALGRRIPNHDQD